MAKILVERPRTNKIHEYHDLRASRKHDFSEEAPLSEGMRRPHISHYDGKQLNDYLAPLRRFLKKQVGRPWNKVYSEIRSQISPGNPIQMHIMQHLKGYISTNVTRDKSGQIWEDGRYMVRKGDMYVNAAGIICVFKGAKAKIELKPGQKIYTLYKMADRLTSGLFSPDFDKYRTYSVSLHIVTWEKYKNFLENPKRKEVFHFVASSYQEALKEIDSLKKSWSWQYEQEIKIPR
jgi:hypothetical protein